MKMFLYILCFLMTLFLIITFTLPGLTGSTSAAAHSAEMHARAIPKML
ncbi:hypothetical protein EDF81_1021 [Enterobacter sp. BIGb0383]|nr:hypothetical protein EDF81_1021 [Enterobacter sp. BIGb0383]ROS12688.1 hypothetical protein EC848_1024 [Enterobacter sp. BIGb0359]